MKSEIGTTKTHFRGRRLRKVFAWLLLVAFVFGVWHFRLPLTDTVAHRVLAHFKIEGVSWQLEEATWGRLRLSEIWIVYGDTSPNCTQEFHDSDSGETVLIQYTACNFGVGVHALFLRAEVNWSLRGLLNRRIDRVEINDLQLPTTFADGRFDAPLIPWVQETMTHFQKPDTKSAAAAPWRIGSLSLDAVLVTNSVLAANLRLVLRDDDGDYYVHATARSGTHVAVLDAKLDADNRLEGNLFVPRIAIPGVAEVQDVVFNVAANLANFSGAVDFSTRISTPNIDVPPVALSGRVEASLATNIIHLAVSGGAELPLNSSDDVLAAVKQYQKMSIDGDGDVAATINAHKIEFRVAGTYNVEKDVLSLNSKPSDWLDVRAINLRGEKPSGAIYLNCPIFNRVVVLPNNVTLRIGAFRGFVIVEADVATLAITIPCGGFGAEGDCTLGNGIKFPLAEIKTWLKGNLTGKTLAGNFFCSMDAMECVLPPEIHEQLNGMTFLSPSTDTTRVRLPSVSLYLSTTAPESENAITISGLSIPPITGKLTLKDGVVNIGELHATADAILPFVFDANGFATQPLKDNALFASVDGVTLGVDDVNVSFVSNTVHAATSLSLKCEEQAGMSVHLSAELSLDAPERMAARIKIPETTLNDDDPLVAWIKDKVPTPLDMFRATFGGEARVELSRGKPLVSATGFAKDVSVSAMEWTLENLETSPISIELRNGRLRTTDSPTIRFETLTHAGGFALGPGEVQGRVSGNEGFLEKAKIGWGDGALRMYAVRFNPESLCIDTRLYIDRVDVGSALALFPTFTAEGSGVLYGELPINYADKHIRLSEGFLYSLPGERGELCFLNPAEISNMLGMVGITDNARIAESLRRIEFSLLRLDLNATDPDDTKLRFRVEGTSLSEKQRGTPVNLNINLNAPLELLLNTGMRMNNLYKKP